ncbi:MAG: sec-independent protein translocase protein TatA [Fimbriimonadaceae bacterium]|jgi:sec-independent protein translocase protein TatA|nr:sec-independent protein translocase protein TatA [Fimbriimonadaceae bacterium]
MNLFQPTHLLIVLIIVLLLFGGKKIPELMRGIGQGVGELKKGINEGRDENPPPAAIDERPMVDEEKPPSAL